MSQVQSLLYEQLSARAADDGRRFPSAELVRAASRGDYNRAIALIGAGADPNSSDASLTALQVPHPSQPFEHTLPCLSLTGCMQTR